MKKKKKKGLDESEAGRVVVPFDVTGCSKSGLILAVTAKKENGKNIFLYNKIRKHRN